MAQRRWITEGVHLGWTELLFEEAEVIVWLDHVSWYKASRGISARFIRGAVASMRRRTRGRELLRFRDYGRQLVGLARAIMESRAYYGARPSNSEAVDDYVRGATAYLVARYRHKLVHCRSQREIDMFVVSLAPHPPGVCGGHFDRHRP